MEPTPENKDTSPTPDNGSEKSACFNFETLLWWTMLVVAILAIPSAAAIITSALPAGGIAQVLIFVVACWGCTWVGMWLMRKADEREMNNKE